MTTSTSGDDFGIRDCRAFLETPNVALAQTRTDINPFIVDVQSDIATWLPRVHCAYRFYGDWEVSRWKILNSERDFAGSIRMKSFPKS
jgi:hypothetical protein